MRQIRSADPWSTFLTTSGRGGGITAARAGGPSHAPPSGHPDPGDAPDAAGLTGACRRVLARLGDRGPQTLEQLRHATGLGLLEVADAVERLAGLGLVAVEREVDELVRLAE
ncbi:hypothetical protein [Spirillospora sp. NPDC029432]|uniref:hypothetical protein n=1 Tax=Spirillospora sp. NPDC029432 TaxID=3154599 RepID=UPI0034516097